MENTFKQTELYKGPLLWDTKSYCIKLDTLSGQKNKNFQYIKLLKTEKV